MIVRSDFSRGVDHRFQKRSPRDRVQSDRRIIQHEQIRLGREHHRQAQSRALAARQASRAILGIDAEELQHRMKQRRGSIWDKTSIDISPHRSRASSRTRGVLPPGIRSALEPPAEGVVNRGQRPYCSPNLVRASRGSSAGSWFSLSRFDRGIRRSIRAGRRDSGHGRRVCRRNIG